jgi:nesprin-1
MDAQYKMMTKTAHLVAKESPQEEANEMFATMSQLKEKLSKVWKYCNIHLPWAPTVLSAPHHPCHPWQILYLSTNHAFVSYWYS